MLEGDEEEKLGDLPPLEANEEEVKGIIVLTPNKLLTRLLVLAKIKARNNSH